MAPALHQTLGGQGTAASTIDSARGPHAVGGSANDIFNFEEYVQNVRENQAFFEKFVRTQAFINFIEQAFYEEQGNLSDASIRFFKECTRKLSRENIQAVRAMQDSMIQGLMHKFNNRSISYSIDKCHLLYDKILRATPLPTLSPNSNFGLISNLRHDKILALQPFDPSPLIKQKFNKVETIFDVKHLGKQKSNKKPSNYYIEFMSDLLIDEPPPDLQPQQLTSAEYFTVQPQ